MSGIERLRYYNERLEEENEKLKSSLRITVPKGVGEKNISVSKDFVKCTLSVSIPRANELFLYKNPIVGSSNNVKDIIVESDDDSLNVEITMDKAMEPELTFEDQYMYIKFRDPHEIYDKIVVIDAGHGGSDPGTIAEDVYESDIDLAIAGYLRDYLEASGVHVYMTRSVDTNVTLESRVNLANSVKADAFISVHCNSARYKNQTYSGTQLLFNDQDESKASLELAKLCMEGVTQYFGSERLITRAGNDIYIVRNSNVPVALVEVGFLSNKDELAKLTNPEYQKKAAQGLASAVSKAYLQGVIHG